METPLVYSLREQIAHHIRQDVLSGRLAAGMRLNEVTLVKRFGVSRTPVREALQQLTFEGLLEARPNAGVTVAALPPDAIRQLVVPIRLTVETYALQTIFPTLGEADFRRWQTILEEMRRACVERDYTKICEQDIAFHRSIVARAGQKDLDAIWLALIVRVRAHFWETQRAEYDDPLEIYEEHAALVETFRSGDLAKSIAALQENIA